MIAVAIAIVYGFTVVFALAIAKAQLRLNIPKSCCPLNTHSRNKRISSHLQYLLHRKKIQNGTNGHCSIEDAKACMELVQLKIQNGKHLSVLKPVQFVSTFARLCVRHTCRKNVGSV